MNKAINCLIDIGMNMGIIALGLMTLRPLSIGFNRYWSNHQILSYNLACYLLDDEEEEPNL